MARESTVKHAVNHSGGVGGEASRPRSSMQGEAEKRGGIYLFTTERERQLTNQSVTHFKAFGKAPEKKKKKAEALTEKGRSNMI